MKSLTLKTLGVAMFCTLAVIGCKKEDKTQAEEKPTVTPISNLSCDDASIKNALVQELTGVVEKQISGKLGDFDDHEDMDLESKVKARLPEIAVDLQNVRQEADVCKTELVITMPMSDVGYANRHFKAQDEPSVGEQAEKAGIKFNDNSFTSTISYSIEGGNVKLDGTPDILNLVAGATSVATYAMIKSGNDKATTRPSTANNNNRPVAPPPAPVVKVRPKPADTTHNPPPPKPVSNKPKTDNNTASTQKTETAKTNTNNNQKLDVPKTENTTTEKPKSEARPEPKALPKEPVKDTTSEITIVETDETY